MDYKLKITNYKLTNCLHSMYQFVICNFQFVIVVNRKTRISIARRIVNHQGLPEKPLPHCQVGLLSTGLIKGSLSTDESSRSRTEVPHLREEGAGNRRR